MLDKNELILAQVEYCTDMVIGIATSLLHTTIKNTKWIGWLGAHDEYLLSNVID